MHTFENEDTEEQLLAMRKESSQTSFISFLHISITSLEYDTFPGENGKNDRVPPQAEVLEKMSSAMPFKYESSDEDSLQVYPLKGANELTEENNIVGKEEHVIGEKIHESPQMPDDNKSVPVLRRDSSEFCPSDEGYPKIESKKHFEARPFALRFPWRDKSPTTTVYEECDNRSQLDKVTTSASTGSLQPERPSETREAIAVRVNSVPQLLERGESGADGGGGANKLQETRVEGMSQKEMQKAEKERLKNERKSQKKEVKWFKKLHRKSKFF